MITILLYSDIVKQYKANRTFLMRSRTSQPHLKPAQIHAVADLFAALSEPSRLRILQILQAGESSVGDLVENTGLKQANVSKQLGILQSAGIVARRQEANRAIYSIAMPVIFDLCALVCKSVTHHAKQRAAALTAK